MDGISSMHGADEMCMQNVSRKLEDEANHSEYISVKGRILLKKIFKKKKNVKMWIGFVWLEVVLKQYVVLGIVRLSSSEAICCIGNCETK